MVIEIAAEWHPTLYPELEEAGGLPQALRRALARVSVDLMPVGLDPPVIVYAIVRGDERSTQVMIDAKERAFEVDFWHRGLRLDGRATSLDEVARAIVAFQVDVANTDVLTSSFSWIKDRERVREEEAGIDAFLAFVWRGLCSSLAYDASRPFPTGQLLPLVLACARRPRLLQLYPFTSVNRLCLSRTTEYPYTWDSPKALPLEDGRFRVVHGRNYHVYGEGDATEAARLIDEHLPAEYQQPAIFGTAEDLP